MRVTINFPDDLIHRLDGHVKSTYRNAKLRSYVVSQAVEEYLTARQRNVIPDNLTGQTKITGNKKGLAWRASFNVPLFQNETNPGSKSHVPRLIEPDNMKKEAAMVFNVLLGLYQEYDDVSPGMIAAVLQCSPVHIGSILNHLGISRVKRASAFHPMAHFVLWDNGLMEDLFKQYGHEEFQSQFPGAKPYYTKVKAEF